MEVSGKSFVECVKGDIVFSLWFLRNYINRVRRKIMQVSCASGQEGVLLKNVFYHWAYSLLTVYGQPDAGRVP